MARLAAAHLTPAAAARVAEILGPGVTMQVDCELGGPDPARAPRDRAVALTSISRSISRIGHGARLPEGRLRDREDCRISGRCWWTRRRRPWSARKR